MFVFVAPYPPPKTRRISSPQNQCGWKMIHFLLGWPGLCVSFRECALMEMNRCKFFNVPKQGDDPLWWYPPHQKNEHARTKIMVISFPNGPCLGGRNSFIFRGGGNRFQLDVFWTYQANAGQCELADQFHLSARHVRKGPLVELLSG